MLLSTHALSEIHSIQSGPLPEVLQKIDFEALWKLHPDNFHIIRMGGRLTPTPRWQQAYGHDYRYTGQVNTALAVPEILLPFLSVAQEVVPEVNGLLLNWYDGDQGHYIGKHRDSMVGLIPNTSIISFSLGMPRTFRFRPWKESGFVDFDTGQHPMIIFSWEVNRHWTHEVLKGKGRRISITLRAFRREI